MENVKNLIEELQTGKASLEEFKKDPAAFIAAGGYDCTVDELKEAFTMARPLDEEELEAVSGGYRSKCLDVSMWNHIKGAAQDLGDAIKSLF